MARVAILLQVMLLTPQLLRPEAQSDPARTNVGFQTSVTFNAREQLLLKLRTGSQVGQPTTFLMNLIPSAPLTGIGNLLLGPINPPLQTVLLQPLRPL